MSALLSKDLAYIWHPCAQMKDFETHPPLLIQSASGAYLRQTDGSMIIDAISSWWCKNLGHGHPAIKKAIAEQLEQFEHVMFGNTTYEIIIQLSEQLTQLLPSLNKVLYASDGSCAVEMALKMSLHSRAIRGEPERNQFMALENSYHGETGLAMAVSDLGIYRKPYQAVLPSMHFLKGIPYVSGKQDPLWDDCSSHWPMIAEQLNCIADRLSAIIIEPIVQGAGGMLMYSQDFLRRLRIWTREHGIHLIADEIMTGFYRTGPQLACHHAAIEPDFLCLAKGLTGGFLPLSATLTTHEIYDLFYSDYEKGHTFYHSHTHSGNALAAAAALACLGSMKTELIAEKTNLLEPLLQDLMYQVAEETGCLTNIRQMGGIVAADLINTKQINRLGYKLGQIAMKNGALIRPIGNTFYWLPPLNIEPETLVQLRDITIKSIRQLML
ncbi:MAG: adenosylmethionine--8-amino-7-oxononanoate transaminase [Gammaproteobacteria bacterium]|nr:adenosylmethionine--8-amino-7-oxononanoate transaminase [Gammaproteobacteria bacterium]